MSGIEDLIITLVELVIGKVSVALSYRYITVTCELLGELKIPSRTSQHCGHEIVTEGVWCDHTLVSLTERFACAFVNDGSSSCRGNWKNL
jgi:hypothetical protein